MSGIFILISCDTNTHIVTFYVILFRTRISKLSVLKPVVFKILEDFLGKFI